MRFFSKLFKDLGKPSPPQNPPPVPVETRPKHELTEPMLFYLYDAAGWLRFVGILLLIKSGLFILGGLVFSIGILVASGFTYVYDDYGLEFMGLAFALLGAVFFFPARYVYRFGTKIRKYRFSKKDGDMESALKNNKSFWKFAGILCIVFLALIPLFLVLAIAGGILAGFGAAIL